MKLAHITMVVATATLLSAQSFAADHFLADRHTAKGISCTMCHGPDQKNLQEPTTQTCTTCHNVKALVEKTKEVKPTNPHVSPHYADELDCNSCHLGHMQSENFCNQCHQFNFNVP